MTRGKVGLGRETVSYLNWQLLFTVLQYCPSMLSTRNKMQATYIIINWIVGHYKKFFQVKTPVTKRQALYDFTYMRAH